LFHLDEILGSVRSGTSILQCHKEEEEEEEEEKEKKKKKKKKKTNRNIVYDLF
jgi:hypothetical protein